MKKIELPNAPDLHGKTRFDADEAGQNKQFWIIIAAFAALLALIAGLVFWIFGGNGGDEKHSGYKISQKDKENIQSQAKGFIEKSGTWGLKNESLTDENVMNTWYTVRMNTPNSVSFFVDRQTQYKELKDKLIAPGGNISFSDSGLKTWKDEYSRDNMISFKVQSFEIPNMPNRGDDVSSDTEVLATVPVKFESVENTVIPTGTDSAWNGSFKQMQKTFSNEGVLTMAKTKDSSGDWRVKDVVEMTNPFALATWDTPNRNYNESQFGMREIKKYYGSFAQDYDDGITNKGKVWVYGD